MTKKIDIKILQSSGVSGLDKYYIAWGIIENTWYKLCTYLRWLKLAGVHISMSEKLTYCSIVPWSFISSVSNLYKIIYWGQSFNPDRCSCLQVNIFVEISSEFFIYLPYGVYAPCFFVLLCSVCWLFYLLCGWENKLQLLWNQWKFWISARLLLA